MIKNTLQTATPDWHSKVCGKRVIVGMSGGVDSSVAAYLLKSAGAEVHGVFMKNWEEEFDTGFCTSAEDLNDAQKVADTLGIYLHKVNFAKDYKERVFSYFLDTLKAGLTPNPDVLCNKEIKFKAFLDHAHQLGADFIATGHYARTRTLDGQTQLLKGLDNNKDQSYFLHLLNQNQLSQTIFPIGELEKSAVRAIALREKLITFDKKDSTGICFIGERDFSEFIGKYLPSQKGDMITPEGEIIAQHNGLAFYTIGQRKGLKIGGRKNSDGKPWFVVDKLIQTNQLVIAQGEHKAMFGQALIALDPHWIDPNWIDSNGVPKKSKLRAKIRYRQQDQSCTIIPQSDNSLLVNFDEPQRAITPGQSIVFYDDDTCLGGAFISIKLK
ncbi:tRNA(Gln,Lys,Glu) U34 2-thiouridylase [Gammaproteobacteria bacterium]|nr:tRNA(Gln,Lys,Glu) U34 2-thiouridylase [Gammaproteobacteria bacterium]